MNVDAAMSTATINAALSANRSVTFLSGNYTITATLLIPSNTEVRGDGHAVLTANGNFPIFKFIDGTAKATRSSLRNFRLTCARETSRSAIRS